MINVFGDAILEGRAHGDVIEQREMLNVFAKAYPTRVWTHRHLELCGHQNHRQDFVDTGETATVDLAEANRIRLQKLFEDHAILASLTGRHADRRHRFRDPGRSEERRVGKECRSRWSP